MYSNAAVIPASVPHRRRTNAYIPVPAASIDSTDQQLTLAIGGDFVIA